RAPSRHPKLFPAATCVQRGVVDVAKMQQEHNGASSPKQAEQTHGRRTKNTSAPVVAKRHRRPDSSQLRDTRTHTHRREAPSLRSAAKTVSDVVARRRPCNPFGSLAPGVAASSSQSEPVDCGALADIERNVARETVGLSSAPALPARLARRGRRGGSRRGSPRGRRRRGEDGGRRAAAMPRKSKPLDVLLLL
ncbi:unnamed protein product, partial [Ixodes hexagonus]